MPTRYDDIDEDEVLWIAPEICRLAELPDGFALRVEQFLGREYTSQDPPRVWVRGPALDAHGATLRTLTLCVPVDQPRAVRATPVPAAPPPPRRDRRDPPRPVAVAAAIGAHRAGPEEPGTVEHAGRRYRRVL